MLSNIYRSFAIDFSDNPLNAKDSTVKEYAQNGSNDTSIEGSKLKSNESRSDTRTRY